LISGATERGGGGEGEGEVEEEEEDDDDDYRLTHYLDLTQR
jgi:hypothetical protein